MPYNRYQFPNYQSEVARLGVLMDELVAAYGAGAATTREELLNQWSAVIGTFQATLGSIIVTDTPVLRDSEPLSGYHNRHMQDIAHDLSVLFIQLRLLGQLVSETFDQTIIEHQDLVGHLRRIASKLGDLKLYESTEGELINVNFVNSNGLDVGSDLLTSAQAHLVFEEGVATLAQTQSDER